MSYIRCDGHGKRADGRLIYTYPAILDGVHRRSARLRLCADCVHDFVLGDDSWWRDASSDDFEIDTQVCSACTQAALPDVRLASAFCTVYWPGDNRTEYFGVLCPTCADAFSKRYSLKAA